ncbi:MULTISPECIES: recombinase family protein [unclassified Arthrobacter]|uniref:recombinase family protein n=1 Tax=unclassified Arthrobacter TaxID=235627 RepID=UPI003395F366
MSIGRLHPPGSDPRKTPGSRPAVRQHAGLNAAGCHRIFTGHGVSGTSASRPELDKMRDHLRDGDEVVVWKLDQAGGATPVPLPQHRKQRTGLMRTKCDATDG